MTDLLITPDLKEETTESSDEPIHSHIIEESADGRSPEVLIMEARINGTPVTALCGYVWVPSRDPEKYPLCPKCEELYEFAKDLWT